MGNFLKKLSLPKIFSKKQIVFPFLLFLIFALFYPEITRGAEVRWYDFLWAIKAMPGVVGGAAAWTGEIILGAVLQFILLMAEGVLALGIAVIGWVIDWTMSSSLSLTSPAKNDIIAIGWPLVRDFINIGFILGLVYIGLATALGIVGFELKKAFSWLLIMALAINFTPLIAGIIVDASTIITRFFLEEMAGWDSLYAIFAAQGAAWKQIAGGGAGFTPHLKFLLLIAFGFTGGFTLLVFSALLLVRTVMIPILVILSPLAFFAYIFK